ncbi:HalOD1 output domain-containing protein [Natrinema caseinilyticum]|uniref:HalOD1 output domain-containing protein n=1 Tax=Natrinema caseinilyticum TaxID=2961570 RepID=UPI0020C2F85E|nr:HalOD1 output domain-containing protein [Natrinema caseinilyticum]
MNPDFAGGSEPPERAEYRYDCDTPPSIAIVRAIAVLENIDPIESASDLGITLCEHVDPSALDRLVTDADGASRVTVRLTIQNDRQYAVQIRDSGLVVVEKDR